MFQFVAKNKICSFDTILLDNFIMIHNIDKIIKIYYAILITRLKFTFDVFTSRISSFNLEHLDEFSQVDPQILSN